MILIDRTMPKSCERCMCNDDYYRCGLTGEELDYNTIDEQRMPKCPLREADVIEVGKWYTGNLFNVEQTFQDGHKMWRLLRENANV